MVHFIRSPTWIAPPSYKTWKSGKVVEILGSLDMDGETSPPNKSRSSRLHRNTILNSLKLSKSRSTEDSLWLVWEYPSISYWFRFASGWLRVPDAERQRKSSSSIQTVIYLHDRSSWKWQAPLQSPHSLLCRRLSKTHSRTRIPRISNKRKCPRCNWKHCQNCPNRHRDRYRRRSRSRFLDLCHCLWFILPTTLFCNRKERQPPGSLDGEFTSSIHVLRCSWFPNYFSKSAHHAR